MQNESKFFLNTFSIIYEIMLSYCLLLHSLAYFVKTKKNRFKGDLRMLFLLFLLYLLVPSVMLYLLKKWTFTQKLYDIIALLSVVLFSIIVTNAIYIIVLDNTVFMTNIHALFLNKIFLLVGGYLLFYIIYQLLRVIFHKSFR